MLYLKGPIWALNFQIFHKVGINKMLSILLTTAWTFIFIFFYSYSLPY